jgi:hypothetical protein
MRRLPPMRKLQDEVRSIVPQGQETVSENDMNNMPYLSAVIKESLRLHPVAPFLALHLATADCDIDGYMIPAGTRVIVNAWAIGRNLTSWENAEEFRPERFVEKGNDVHVNFKGNDFQFLPFGAGRRMCPGMNLGIANVKLMLANLMYSLRLIILFANIDVSRHILVVDIFVLAKSNTGRREYHFDWEPLLGVEREGIDMTEVFGLTVRLKEKLLLIPKSRV